MSDLLDFIDEQITQAVSDPADQLAAIDAASGVLPLLGDRLHEPEGLVLWTQFVLVFDGIDGHWREWWDNFAKLPRDDFKKEAAKLCETISLLKRIVAST